MEGMVSDSTWWSSGWRWCGEGWGGDLPPMPESSDHLIHCKSNPIQSLVLMALSKYPCEWPLVFGIGWWRCSQCWCQEPHVHGGDSIQSCEGCFASFGSHLCTPEISWPALASHPLRPCTWADIGINSPLDFGPRGHHNIDHGIYIQDKWKSGKWSWGNETCSSHADQRQAVPTGVMATCITSCWRESEATSISTPRCWLASCTTFEIWSEGFCTEEILESSWRMTSWSQRPCHPHLILKNPQLFFRLLQSLMVFRHGDCAAKLQCQQSDRWWTWRGRRSGVLKFWFKFRWSFKWFGWR